MTPEERQLLAGLFDRTRSASGQYRDPQAESLIADCVREQPYAPYLLAQTVIVQEQALQAANQKLQQLEARVAELEQQAQAPAQPQQGSFLGGLGQSIFGSAPPAPAPRTSVPSTGASPWGRTTSDPAAFQPQAQQPPQSPWQQGPQAGAWQQPPAQQGGSFLKGALGAAAGVAGGMLLANSIRGLFEGHHNSYGISSGYQGTNDGGFDPLPQGRIGNEPAPDAAPSSAAYAGPSAQDLREQDQRDDAEADSAESGWDSNSDDTADV